MNAISSVSSISLSGLQAAQSRLDVSANNIANADTEGFHRQDVEQTAEMSGGVYAEVKRASVPGAQTIADAINQIAAKQDFMANLAVFKTSNQMLGKLLDTQA